MDYDVLILGGGIIGCAIAYELSKYNLNISVIEKDYDICNDTPSINTSVIYDGLECDDEISSKFIRQGNILMEGYAEKFNFPYNRVGTIYISNNEEEKQQLDHMYSKAKNKNIQEVKLLSKEDINAYEPNINEKAEDALYIPHTGVFGAYDLALAYGEVAFDNGVNFKFEEEVESIESISKGFRIKTSKNKFTCKILIDTTKDTNLQRSEKEINKLNEKHLKYMVINKPFNKIYNNIIFKTNNTERICIRPSIRNEIVCSYTNNINVPYDRVIEKVKLLIGEFNEKEIKLVRDWKFAYNPIAIEDDIKNSGYINISVNHYAKATMAPALALNITKSVIEKLNCKFKKDFNDKRREYFRFKDMSEHDINKIIEVDSKYGNIVCQCEKVTEGEIVDSIRRPLGARTLTGVKRRTGAGFGSCDGCYCKEKIIEILARETNKRITEVVNNAKDSKVLMSRIKEFDNM